MNTISNLVFEGGGVRGIAYAGAAAELEQRGILNRVERFAGTSAGASTAAFLAAGASAGELARIVRTTPWRAFEDHGWAPFGQLVGLLRDFGWYRGQVLERWTRQQLATLTGGDGSITFAELATFHRPVSVVATDLSTRQPVVFSAEITPDVPVYQGVRASMGIPLYFANYPIGDDIYVDGGCSWNYPIDLFDSPQPDGSMLANPATLGFRLSAPDPSPGRLRAAQPVPPAPPLPWPGPTADGDFYSKAMALIDFFLDMANRSHLKDADRQRTVFIPPTPGVSATSFDLSAGQMQALVEAGRLATAAHLDATA